MNPSLLIYLLASTVIALTGCGKNEAPATVATPVQPLPALSDLAADLSPPPGFAVDPLAASAPSDGSPANPDPAALSRYVLEDSDGTPLTDSVKILQRAVEIYDEHRREESWPELKDLSQLVQYKVLNRLPPAPPGQRFDFDVRRQEVKVAKQ